MNDLRAPFPWFGGKSRVAEVVWRAFGNVPNYVEPFAGSLAVMLGRPHEPKIETVNDRDCYLSNFWRAVKEAPHEVAAACDWPVNEADLHARHRWLVEQTEFREKMLTDPDFYDVKIAGWWVWGLSQWIGGGWCHLTMPNMHAGRAIHTGGIRTQRRRPQCAAGSAGQGVLKTHLPSLGNMRGILGDSKAPCADWFLALQERLRRVRVVCGDWQRVLGDSVLGTTDSRNSGMNPCGLFLDPPYSGDVRDPDLYAQDDGSVAAKVAAWAITRADDPDLRIALCGYEGEHEMPETWTKYAWKAHRGYASAENENVHRERIWFSPHCLPIDPVQKVLFA